MLDIGNNYGKDRTCKCGEKETTEHLIMCSRENGKEIDIEWIKETNEIQKIRKVNEYLERIIQKRNE